MEKMTDYVIPIVVLACLCAGYVVKKSLDFIPNKYIPLILVILGAILACVTKKEIHLEHIVYGAVSGLMSIGLYETFRNLIEGGKK